MIEQIQKIEEEIDAYQFNDASDVEKYRIHFLGSKGLIKGLYALLREVPNDQKKEFGQKVNDLRTAAEKKLNDLKADGSKQDNDKPKEDLSKPVGESNLGSHHPLSIVKREIVDIFNKIGFSISEGPEIEDDWHNFSALNFPPEHPARDMQDTFFIQKGE